MIVIIDNYDSFTYNLFQYVGQFYNDTIVLKNDDSTIDSLDIKKIKAFIFSPGPGRPSFAGKMPDLIKLYSATIPMLGICLGHQAIIENFGGIIKNSDKICHGKVHLIEHYSTSKIFNNVSKLFKATRYHSLVAEEDSFPSDSLIITARTENGLIMALEHKIFPVFGVQFHPESIVTEHGVQMVKNFLEV